MFCGILKHIVIVFQDVWKYNTLDSKVAAGLIVNYGHALLSLFRRAKIKKDNTLLITVDSGGLGLAALDVAANVYKAKVNNLNTETNLSCFSLNLIDKTTVLT